MSAQAKDTCVDGTDHIWVLTTAHGYDQVHCARCQRCLDVERMLRAYVTLHGGEVRRG